MDCIQPNVCNCIRDCSCDEGYQCCSQEVPSGTSTYGMCVKQGFCDKKRGIPDKSCKNLSSNNEDSKDVKEPYIFRENFLSNDCDCNNWKKALILMSGITLLLVVLIVFLRYSTA
jgi:hypothetical protein